MTCKNRPDMTNNVFGGTLNLALSMHMLMLKLKVKVVFDVC